MSRMWGANQGQEVWVPKGLGWGREGGERGATHGNSVEFVEVKDRAPIN